MPKEYNPALFPISNSDLIVYVAGSGLLDPKFF